MMVQYSVSGAQKDGHYCCWPICGHGPAAGTQRFIAEFAESLEAWIGLAAAGVSSQK
jgi:hypothetical protein